jgi:hypothetical protein
MPESAAYREQLVNSMGAAVPRLDGRPAARRERGREGRIGAQCIQMPTRRLAVARDKKIVAGRE